MYEMDRSGEDPKNWNVWWHSHASMGVFWSGTDNDTIVSHANNGGFLISIVTNKEGKFKTRFDIFPKDISPLGVVTYYKAADDIDTEILPSMYNPTRRKEVAEILNVKIEKVEKDIKEIEDAYKEKIEQITKELQEEKSNLIQQLKLNYDTENMELEDEYKTLSGAVAMENEELKTSIENEVLLKVTTPVIVSYSDDGGKSYWSGSNRHQRRLENREMKKMF
jgi:hypothetical protein